MARVLVSESDPGVRSLLQAVLEREGHEVLVLEGELLDGDLLVAEPAYGNGLVHAATFRLRDEALPIVLVSILPPESRFLALSPAAYLVKPFRIGELAGAVAAALTSSGGAARSPGRLSPAPRG